MNTDLPETLIEAYRSTAYCASLPTGETRLRIGEQNDALQNLLRKTGAEGALFITAYNPFGEALSDDDNALCHKLLTVHLDCAGIVYFEGEGIGDAGNWPPETSLLAIDVTREQAAFLGDHFQQNAVVWVTPDAVPELLLLR